MRFRIGSTLLVAAATVSLVNAPVASASCLDQAAGFAERVCGDLLIKGRSNLVSSSGELTAEAQGVITRIIGAVRGDAKVDAASRSFEGVLQEELTKNRKDTQGCRERMVAVAMQQQICTAGTLKKIVCTGEHENSCPGQHDIFYTCGYFGTDKEIADSICEGIKAGHVRLKTIGGHKCGYALIEVSCKIDP